MDKELRKTPDGWEIMAYVSLGGMSLLVVFILVALVTNLLH